MFKKNNNSKNESNKTEEIKTFKLPLVTTLNCNHLDGVLWSWFFENISGLFGLGKLLTIQTNEQYFI